MNTVKAYCQRLKGPASPFEINHHGIKDLATSLRTPPTNLGPLCKHLEAIGESYSSRVEPYKLFGMMAQICATVFPELRANTHEILDAASLEPFVGSVSMRTVTDQIHRIIAHSVGGHFAGLLNDEKVEDRLMSEPYLLENIEQAFRDVLGGAREAAAHLGAIMEATLLAYSEHFGRAMSPEEFKRVIEGFKMELRSLSELNMVEIKFFDDLVTAGFNPYKIVIDSSAGEDVFLLTFHPAYIEASLKVLECYKCNKPLHKLIEAHASAYDLLSKNGGIGRELLTELEEDSCERLEEYIELKTQIAIGADNKDWIETLGCPATRAGVINEWFHLMVEFASGYYERSLGE